MQKIHAIKLNPNKIFDNIDFVGDFVDKYHINVQIVFKINACINQNVDVASRVMLKTGIFEALETEMR